MTTTYTNLLGLALPVTGELSGTWGTTVNDFITEYLDASVAGTQTISGSQTAVTLSKTTNAALSQAGSGATGSSQYMVINCTGNPASLLTITAPAASKAYIIINATSTNQQVKIVGAGPTTGVTLVAGEKAIVAWNGSDFVKAASTALLGKTDTASPYQTSLGAFSAASNTGTYNTFIGYNSGFNNTTGTSNTAVGANSLQVNTTGSHNTAVGYRALNNTTTGAGNIAVGSNALLSNTGGGGNIGIGGGVLQNNTLGGANIAIGGNAQNNNTDGAYNIALGNSALYVNSNGDFNIAVGHGSLTNFLGDRALAIGYQALYSHNVLSSNTTAVGYQAGYGLTSGSENTFLGHTAGYSGTNNLSTGSNNTLIGYNAAASSATVSNEITLGNSSIATLRCQVTTITSLSDARDKKDVVSLPAGLSFVRALNPVAFKWNTRDGAKVDVPDTGFIAQELQAAQTATGVTIPGLVYDSNPDQLEAGYGKLIPVLVKAIQELSAEVERLKSKQG